MTTVEIARAATNAPELSTDSFILGDREYIIVDLDYKNYVLFLSKLHPLLKQVATAFVNRANSEVLNSVQAVDLVTFMADELPDMVAIICRATDPSVTVDDVLKNAKSPFQLATIVLKQIQQNRMVEDITNFFVQTALPLLSAVGGKWMTEETLS